MRNPVVTIFKKELARFFGDRRMALTTILLPGLMIYVLYTFMGSALTSQFSVEDMYRPTAVVENLPDSLTSALSQVLEIQEQSDPMEQVRDQELDLYICFPEDFDQAVAGYDIASGAAAPPGGDLLQLRIHCLPAGVQSHAGDVGPVREQPVQPV